VADIERAEKVTLSFVSRHSRIAYLAPAVLDSLLFGVGTSAVSIDRLGTPGPPAVGMSSRQRCSTG